MKDPIQTENIYERQQFFRLRKSVKGVGTMTQSENAFTAGWRNYFDPRNASMGTISLRVVRNK